jgi:hypothetical protein
MEFKEYQPYNNMFPSVSCAMLYLLKSVESPIKLSHWMIIYYYDAWSLVLEAIWCLKITCVEDL